MHPTKGWRLRARRGIWMATSVAVGTVLMVACGTSSSPSDETPSAARTAGFPVTIDSTAGRVEIPAQPQRIISLSPSATEMLFAIDAGNQVVAVDDQSDYPTEAPTTELSGIEPNVEAILEYEPDLVVMDVAPPALQRSFEKLEIPLLQQPAPEDVSGTYTLITQLGQATGHATEAEDLVTEMRSEIEQIQASLPTFDQAPTYYHELDDTYYTVTSDTFIGEIYSMVGLVNIADEAKGAGSGYPQLSPEYIIEADPDLIFLADTECCDQSAQTVAKRPGWDQIEAVTAGHVVELSDDVASRWGPRVVDFLKAVADAILSLKS